MDRNNLGTFMRMCLSKAAADAGFENHKLIIEDEKLTDDKFVGIFNRVIVEEVGGENRKLDLIVKLLPKDPAIREKTRAQPKFEREVYIYCSVWPKFRKFQEDRNISMEDGFYSFPKCYYAKYSREIDNGILILENLEPKYKTMSKAPLDFEHASLVMKMLGRWHALSLAVKQEEPEFFDTIKNSKDHMIDLLTNSDFRKFIPINFHRALMVLYNVDNKWSQKITEMCKNLNDHLLELVDYKPAEPFAVITHSDCWTNNLMFCHQDNVPNDVKLIDWQIARYGSPVLDLVYFLFSCTDHKLREEHYDDLLKIYHSSLLELTSKLGASIDFPFFVLQDQLQKYGKFGFICSTYLIPLLTLKKEDIPDPTLLLNILEKPDDYKDTINEYMKPSKTYIELMRGCIMDSFHFGYL